MFLCQQPKGSPELAPLMQFLAFNVDNLSLLWTNWWIAFRHHEIWILDAVVFVQFLGQPNPWRLCSVPLEKIVNIQLLVKNCFQHRTIRHFCQGSSWFTLLVSNWCSSRSHGFCSTVTLQKFSKELLLYRSRNHNGVLKLLSNFLLGLLEIVGLGSMS